MSLVIIYILTIVALAAITYFLYIQINPDISKFIKNEKIKTFLYDCYHIRKNKNKLHSKNLFFLIGKNTNELYHEILKVQNGEFANNLLTDEKIPFEMITVNSVNYLFFNENILINNDYRLKYNINKIVSSRTSIMLDGIIFFPSESAFSNNNINLKEISEEAQIFSKLYRRISLKLKSKIPLFFIDRSKINEIPQFCSSSHTMEQDKSPYFCFIHETIQNSESLNSELIKSIDLSVNALEVQNLLYLKTLNQQYLSSTICFFYKLKHSILCFSKNYIDYFYKSFDKKNKEHTNYHYVINMSCFQKNPINFDDQDSNIFNMIKYFSKNLINFSNVTKEYVSNKLRTRSLVVFITALHLFFATYAVIASNDFLQTNRDFYISKFHKISTYIKEYKKTSDISSVKIEELLDDSDSITKNSLYHALLFPSWSSQSNQEISKKYNQILANFLNEIITDKFKSLVTNLFSESNIDNKSADEILDYCINFIKLNKSIYNVYFSFQNPDSKNYSTALSEMTNFIFKINSSKISIEKNIFSSLNIKEMPHFINIDLKDFNELSNKNLNFLIQSYFNKFNETNKAYLNSKLIEDTLISIKTQSEIEKNKNIIILAKNLSTNLSQLKNSLLTIPKNQKDIDLFYGIKIVELIKETEQNPIFNKTIATKISEIAEENLVQFKYKLSGITPLGLFFPIIVNESDSLTINPALEQIMISLGKLEELPKFYDNENTPRGFLKQSSFEYTPTSLWDTERLKSNLQITERFYQTLQSIKTPEIPDSLTIFLNKFSSALNYEFWKENLPLALKSEGINKNLGDNTTPDNDEKLLANIQVAAPILKQISNQLLASSPSSELYSKLNFIVTQQIDFLINNYYQNLNNTSFFIPKSIDFHKWKGNSSPIFDLFGFTSEDDLKTFLNNQKSSLELYYNKNIAPLLNAYDCYFKSSGKMINNKALLILLNLRNNLATTPEANTYSFFLNYISSNMTQLRLDSCENFALNPPSIIKMNSDDFFAIKLNKLYSPLSNQCKALLLHQALLNYDNFALKFNNLLSGKFPFANESKNLLQNSIDDLSLVISEFKKLEKQDLPILTTTNNPLQDRKDIQNFIKDMKLIVDFLEINSDKDGNTNSPTFKVDFNFRTNTEHENLANQIINWSIQSADRIYGSEYGNKNIANFIWKYSEPIKFAVTLANSSKYQINKNISDKNVLIDNNTVIFNVKDSWSLIKLIFDYSECKANVSKCFNNTLQFKIPLSNKQNIILYTTITLKNLKNQKIMIPNFPTIAPYFDKKSVSSNFNDSINISNSRDSI